MRDILVIVVLLKRAWVFAADLARALDCAGARPYIEFFGSVKDILVAAERAEGSGHHYCFGDEKHSRAPWAFASQ